MNDSRSATQLYLCSGCGENVPGPRPPREYCALTRRAEMMTPAALLEHTMTEPRDHHA